MKRYALIYVATLLIMVPLDLLFLGVLAKDFFKSQAGDAMRENPNLVAAVLFYLIYTAGILVFVSGASASTVQTTLIFGALFGFVAYATFDLTTLAVMKNWSWSAAMLDMAWGSFVTGVSATLGLVIGNWIAERI
jgi:uncharacterized membrane protein